MKPPALTILLAVVMLVPAGCTKPGTPPTRDQLIGKWNFSDSVKDMVLTLNPDSTYSMRQTNKTPSSFADVMHQNLMLLMLSDTGKWNLNATNELEMHGKSGMIMLFGDLHIHDGKLDCNIGSDDTTTFTKGD